MVVVNGSSSENGTPRPPWDWLAVYRIRLLAVTASAIGAAVIAILNITNTAEPYWFATRAFVREFMVSQSQIMTKQLDDLKNSQKATAIFLANSEMRRIKTQLNEKKSLLSDSTASPAIKYAIQQQIDDLTADLERVKKEIDNLSR